MKKIVLFSLILSLTSITIQAQNSRFGLKTGLNFSKFKSDDSAVNDMSYNRTAFHIGALIAFKVSEKVSIQPELYYSSEGGTFKYQEVGENGITNMRTNISTNYMSLPIMVQYYTGKHLFFEAGPQMDFLVSASSKTNAINHFEANTAEVADFMDSMESFNYGLGFGIGYQADNGVFINTRYVMGFPDLSKDEFTSIKNKGFQVSLGFML